METKGRRSYEFPCGNKRFGSDRWKIHDQDETLTSSKIITRKFMRCAGIYFILQCLIHAVNPVSTQYSDGVMVTQADHQALQALKHELHDPTGVLKSWDDTGNGACSGGWVGIKCAQGQVIVIHLPWKGLSGRISESIGQFQALRELSLHDNLIGGMIPISIGFLPDLRGVQLFNNMFSGSIPSSLGQCHLLQTIDLSRNSLSGSIPDSFTNLTKILRLDFSFNQLTGSIPRSLTQSASLQFLALSSNNLSGALPRTWVRTEKLQVLALDYNSFSGSVPCFETISGIQEISLGHNRFRGIIPNFGYNNLSGLEKLDLSSNFITGILPDSLANFKKLSVLDLSENDLSGEIPPRLSELPNLVSFNVSYNNLSGSVPSKLSRKFDATAFSGNMQLCGYNNASIPCPKWPHKKHQEFNLKDIVIILSGIFIAILVAICCILILCLVRSMKMSKRVNACASRSSSGGGIKGGLPPCVEVEESGDLGVKLVHFDEAVAFSMDDILGANAEVLGRSTYGTVYRATMENGIEVAVKRLREKITKNEKEFETEVNVVGKIRHPNLVALRAYYSGPKAEKLLILDYMPKGSLAVFLHERRGGDDARIDWLTRMKIAKGVSKGLVYLHEKAGIIHGNLTSTNVLLDEHANAKIADYGLSRLMTAPANTHVITAAAGLGYRAPELSSKLDSPTAKSDVYGFGVIVLELLTGKSPRRMANGLNLPQWVASMVKKEWTNQVFDSELVEFELEIGDELLSALNLALECVDPSPSIRPDATQILRHLEVIVGSESDGDISGDEFGSLSSPNDSMSRN